jgi:type I restriction-modification system DNA methylase subunit
MKEDGGCSKMAESENSKDLISVLWSGADKGRVSFFEEIEKNDFNLNIPRYVDTFEEEEEIDLNKLITDMQNTDEEMEQMQGEFLSFLKELTSEDAELMATMNRFIERMEG